MLKQEYTTRFEKGLRLMEKRGKDLTKIKTVMATLIMEKPLPPDNKNHKLSGNYKGYSECHIEPDWLLIYKIDSGFILFYRTGTHSDLFN